jgi:hypothetical protein
MFSLVRNVLTPMDLEDPSRVVFIYSNNLQRGWSLSPFQFRTLPTGIFSHLAAISRSGVNLHLGNRTDRVDALTATPEIFGATGFRPVRGRGFTAADSLPGAAPVAAIREEL